MTYQVILECVDGSLFLVGSVRSHRVATRLAGGVLVANGQASGVKVHVRSADSADQLQVSQRGLVLRDQPHLDAEGEALTIHVPTAEARLGP